MLFEKTHRKNELDEYLNTIELSGITIGHKKEVGRFLEKYLEYINYNIDKAKSLSYFKKLKDSCSISYYRKQLYQILKFLTYLSIEWATEIKPPADPVYYPRRVSREDINRTLSCLRKYKHYKQMHAIILLGASSGMRAEEMYQLEPEDIDIENRTVYVNHNPSNWQSTKTRRSRVSFFNEDAQKRLLDYLDYFGNKINV